MNYPLLFQAESVALTMQENLDSVNQTRHCVLCNNPSNTSSVQRRFMTPILTVNWPYQNSSAATQQHPDHTVPMTMSFRHSG